MIASAAEKNNTGGGALIPCSSTSETGMKANSQLMEGLSLKQLHLWISWSSLHAYA